MTQPYLDANSGAPDAGQLDSMALKLTCENLDASQISNLSLAIQNTVSGVMEGTGCNQIMLAPQLTEGCEIPADGVKVDSSIKFGQKHVQVFELKNNDGFSLQEGGMLYEAIVGVCGEYPGASVQALGIELKPKGESYTKVSVKIEDGKEGKVARVHAWGGEVEIGELTLSTGQQVVVRKDENGELVVVSKHDFNPAVDAGGTEFGEATGEHITIDTGCSTAPGAGVNVDPVSALTVGTAALLAIASKRIKASTSAVFTRNSSQ